MVRKNNALLQTNVTSQVKVNFEHRFLQLFATFGPLRIFETFRTSGTSGTFKTLRTFWAFEIYGAFKAFGTVRRLGNFGN